VALNKLPANALGGDVGVAAPGSTAEGFGYVGVWVAEASDCAAFGTADAKNFAVITTSTFRDGPSAAYGNFGALVDNKATLEAGPRSVAITQTAPDALTIDGKSYVRCVP
jgi:hypothetical protein